jgi:hypothetical protein
MPLTRLPPEHRGKGDWSMAKRKQGGPTGAATPRATRTKKAKAAPTGATKPRAVPPSRPEASAPKGGARPKSAPSRREGAIGVMAEISRRLREVRQELFGEQGGPELARRLNLPARTWYNYETGVSVPAEVLLAFVEQTGADPWWVLSGEGAKYRRRDGA